MKNINVLILIFLFFQTNSVVPVWDFPSQSTELFSSEVSSYNYTIYESTFPFDIKLVKVFNRTNNIITHKNYLTIGETTQEVEFEEIDSVYVNELSCSILICPKGKYHPYNYDNMEFIIPDEFEENGDWELKCLKHNTGYFLIFYLNNGYSSFYSYYINVFNKHAFGYQNLYYCLLENEELDNNYEYLFPTIIKDGEYLKLRGCYLSLRTGENKIYLNAAADRSLNKNKLVTKAYIDNNLFSYFFTYDDISSFSSGYSNTYIDFSSKDNYRTSISNMEFVSNISPFSFIDNMDIININFTSYSNILYYKLLNKNNNKINYGIFDIKLNKILYNFDEEIKTFISYSNGEILAITSTSVYKVCTIKEGNECIDSCSSGNLLLDTNGNKCQTDCDDGKIKLMPEEICIEKENCDLNFLILNEDETECGACNYFYPNGTKYKLINTAGCLSDIPANTEYYNEELNILKCKENYHLDISQCIPDFCFEDCETCSEISYNSTNQKCLTC